jgi:hypothetical protein
MSLTAIVAVMLMSGRPPMAVPPVFVGKVEDGMPFKSGPYQGLGVGMVSTPDGKSFRGLMPSRPGASPVSAKNQRAIAAFIAGYSDPDNEPLSPFLTKKSGLFLCKQQGLTCQAEPLKFGESVQANVPFALDDGTVRLEWVYGSALYYITVLTLKKGKIAEARTLPAWMPIEVRKPD